MLDFADVFQLGKAVSMNCQVRQYKSEIPAQSLAHALQFIFQQSIVQHYSACLFACSYLRQAVSAVLEL